MKGKREKGRKREKSAAGVGDCWLVVVVAVPVVVVVVAVVVVVVVETNKQAGRPAG